MSRSLIHRTGINTGRVYNMVGDNLTQYPSGAGNSMTGPWAMDYISIMGTTEAEVGVLWDSEFSGIIADGRAIGNGPGDQPFIFADLDEDEDLTDRRSRIAEGRQGGITIKGVWVRLYHTAPKFTDARVWTVNIDGTHDAAYDQTLADWLDTESGGVEDGLWHSGRHALRVPVRWAIYKCPLLDNYESMLDMVSENSNVSITTGDLMSVGPRGMLTALHGAPWAAPHAVRLYEPSDALGIVERGMFFLPYDGTIADDDTTTPRRKVPVTGTYDIDGNVGQPELEGDLTVALTGGQDAVDESYEESTTFNADGTVTSQRTETTEFNGLVVLAPGGNIDLERSIITPTGTHSLAVESSGAASAAQRNWGTIYSTMVHTRKNVRVTPKFVYVWHLMTCPVRIGVIRDASDELIGHKVIGGLTSPFWGPPVRLVYHEGNAT